MSTNWTAFPFKRALKTSVAARAGITGLTPTVWVVTYFPSPDEFLTDLISLGHTITDDKEKVTVGGKRHDETVNLECLINVVRSSAGEDVANDAEDRAEALLAEVDDEIRTNAPAVGDQTLSANLLSRTSSEFPWQVADGVAVRVCLIEFTIQYRARTST